MDSISKNRKMGCVSLPKKKILKKKENENGNENPKWKGE